MNSNSKFQEQEEQILKEQEAAAAAKKLLQEKVRYQIDTFSMRILSAREELKLLTTAILVDAQDSAALFAYRQRVRFLCDDIIFCKKQINAYRDNDHKSKLIPDRLL